MVTGTAGPTEGTPWTETRWQNFFGRLWPCPDRRLTRHRRLVGVPALRTRLRELVDRRERLLIEGLEGSIPELGRAHRSPSAGEAPASHSPPSGVGMNSRSSRTRPRGGRLSVPSCRRRSSGDTRRDRVMTPRVIWVLSALLLIAHFLTASKNQSHPALPGPAFTLTSRVSVASTPSSRSSLPTSLRYRDPTAAP